MKMRNFTMASILIAGLTGISVAQPGQNRGEETKAHSDSYRKTETPRQMAQPSRNRVETVSPDRPATRIAHTDYRIDNQPAPAFANPSHHEPVTNRGNWISRPRTQVVDQTRDFDRVAGPSFRFGLYLSTFEPHCYASPWRFYPGVPAYLAASAPVFIVNDNFRWNQGAIYRYGNWALDRAVGQLTDLFTNQDLSAANQLTPVQGRVGIFTDGTYNYSMNGADFAAMMEDTVSHESTVSFTIDQIRLNGSQATVQATHIVSTPNGAEDVIYQTYHLGLQNGRFAILDFMTSTQPL